MVAVTKIERAEKTWNPVVGCRRASPGCDNCYAIKEVHRKGSLFVHYSGLTINDGERIDWIERWNVALPARVDERVGVLPA